MVLVGLLGCYAPSAVSGAPCSDAGLCPDPFRCVVGVCVVGDDAMVNADSTRPVPWHLVQTAGTMSGSTLTIMATGADHLIVVGIELSNTESVSAVIDNAGDAYTAVPKARATSAADTDAVELWYAPASNAGATAITVTATSESAVVMWEVANIRTVAPIDAAAIANDQASSGTPLGASITTTAADDFVVSVAIVANVIDSIRAGNAFTNDQKTKGNGWAHLTDSMAAAGTYQAQWDENISGVSCASSAAFFVRTN